MNLITLLILGFPPASLGCVLIGSKLSSFFPETLIEFKSNDIKAFLTGRKESGFKSLKPKALISIV